MVDVNEGLDAPILQRYLQPVNAVLEARRQEQAPGLGSLEPHDQFLGLCPRVLGHEGRHLLAAVQIKRRGVCGIGGVGSMDMEGCSRLSLIVTLAAGRPREGGPRAVAMEPVPTLEAVPGVHARLGGTVRTLDVAGRSDRS
jgi:hypothetical protein